MDFKIEDGILKNYTGHSAGSLTIPETVKELGSWSLDNHPELYYVIISKNIRKIGYHVFYEDENLISVVADRQNKYFSSIGSAAESILCDKQKSVLLCCPGGRESVHIPASITEIKRTDAFAGCKKLRNITVDKNNQNFTVLNGVLYEHDGAKLTKLVRCPVDLTSLYIPDSVTEIYNHAFEHCSQLKEITIPENITELKDYTFRYCKNLERIHFPKRLKNIGQHCFSECDSLTELILPHGLKYIAPAAFNECSSLKKLVIPESVDAVGYSVYHCQALEFLSCRGIVLQKQEFPLLPDIASGIVYTIIHNALKENISPEVKYPVLYQMFLLNQDNTEINAYIRENFSQILKSLIQHNQVNYVMNYLQSFRRFATEQNLDDFIACAIEYKKDEILYQLFLKQPKNQKIYQYLDKNFDEAILRLICDNRAETVKNYIRTFPQYLHAQNLDDFIQRAIDNQKYEIQVYLTDLKYQRGEFTQKDWTL